MKTIVIITILVVLGLSQTPRLSPNDLNCNKYLGKFGTADSPDGQGASKIAFKGDAAFIDGTANVKVNLQYSDFEYFNDPLYFGLVQEDGNKPENTCLDLKLYRFTSDQYSGGTQVTDLTITSSFNFQKQWRYYSFTILGTELSTRLVLDSQNTEQFVYKGYYSIAYYIANTDQLQYTLYFQFTVTVLRSNGAAVDTSFKPISQKESVGCTPNLPCVITAATTLKWCTDLKCTAYETPDLHLNDQFVLQQIVTTAGLTNYYLTGTEVWYTGGGLNKKATLEQVINTTPGQAIIQLKAEIAWRAVTIRVTSVLANASSGRRLLVQSTYDTVNGQTEQIECIKAKGSETCATCEQECQANGFARDGCEECSFSQQIAFVFLALLLALTF